MIFVSYRRKGTQDAALWIADRLKAKFGEGSVFIDVGSIPAGEDFRECIKSKIFDAHVVLVIMGEGWLGPRPNGANRIKDSDDLVRIEIAQAIASRKVLVPVLLNGFRMPDSADLPIDIRDLTAKHAISFGTVDFEQCFSKLVGSIEAFLPGGLSAQSRHSILLEEPIEGVWQRLTKSTFSHAWKVAGYFKVNSLEGWKDDASDRCLGVMKCLKNESFQNFLPTSILWYVVLKDNKLHFYQRVQWIVAHDGECWKFNTMVQEAPSSRVHVNLIWKNSGEFEGAATSGRTVVSEEHWRRVDDLEVEASEEEEVAWTIWDCDRARFFTKSNLLWGVLLCEGEFTECVQFKGDTPHRFKFVRKFWSDHTVAKAEYERRIGDKTKLGFKEDKSFDPISWLQGKEESPPMPVEAVEVKVVESIDTKRIGRIRGMVKTAFWTSVIGWVVAALACGFNVPESGWFYGSFTIGLFMAAGVFVNVVSVTFVINNLLTGVVNGLLLGVVCWIAFGIIVMVVLYGFCGGPSERNVFILFAILGAITAFTGYIVISDELDRLVSPFGSRYG